MTRDSIHCKYSGESSLADWEVDDPAVPNRGKFTGSALTWVGKTVPIIVVFLSQYVSHLFPSSSSFTSFSLLRSLYLFPFLLTYLPSPHFCLCCYSSHLLSSWLILSLPLFFFTSFLFPSHLPESACRSWDSLSPVAPGGPWLVTNYPMALLFLFCLINL